MICQRETQGWHFNPLDQLDPKEEVLVLFELYLYIETTLTGDTHIQEDDSLYSHSAS
jgi:hypothetical protein